MLKVCNLSAGYSKVPIIKNISFELKKGEIACILGQNGSGKTTLLKACAGIISSLSGEVFINGENILNKKRKDIAKLLSLMSGLQPAHFSYTVFQTVMLARYAHSEKSFLSEGFSKADTERVNAILENLHIYSLRDKLLTEVSSGQLQKVFLARTIAQDTPVIFLDEPTSHLDLKAQIEICKKLKTLAQEKKVSMLAVFHDINLAMQLADRLILIKDGKLFENSKKENFDYKKINHLYETDVQNFMLKSFEFWKSSL
ncbi:MAG: ABC transporter ATP-binding protein [Treponemataceae bacterium]